MRGTCALVSRKSCHTSGSHQQFDAAVSNGNVVTKCEFGVGPEGTVGSVRFDTTAGCYARSICLRSSVFGTLPSRRSSITANELRASVARRQFVRWKGGC